jgi:Flp pilus assembly pilin Flp
VRRTDFWSNESGAAVIERAILACVVALVILRLIDSGLSPVELVRRAAFLAEVLVTDEELGQTPFPLQK